MATKAMTITYKGKQIQRGTLAALFAELPKKLRGPATEEAAAQYVARIRKYPPYRWVGRARAYGLQPSGDWSYRRGGRVFRMNPVPGFFSAKQFRFIMASLRAGRNLKTGRPMQPGYPNRTGNTQRGWKVEGKGGQARIVNAEPAAVHLFDNKRQARQPGLVGWQKLDELIADAADEVTDEMLDWAIQRLYKDIDAGLR